jgi:hypothetical protein
MKTIKDYNILAYEFFGDYWYRNPEKFSTDDINDTNKIKFGVLYKNTIERIKSIINSVYSLNYMRK